MAKMVISLKSTDYSSYSSNLSWEIWSVESDFEPPAEDSDPGFENNGSEPQHLISVKFKTTISFTPSICLKPSTRR